MFETVYLSEEGFAIISKLTELMKHFVIKNIQEARLYETPESSRNFWRYSEAYEDINLNSEIYTYNNIDLLNFGYSNSEITIMNSMDTRELRKDNRFRRFLETVRRRIIDEYVELNHYLRQFSGVPLEDDQIIFFRNYDSLYEDDVIAIHKVNQLEFPLTYKELFIKNIIQKYIDENPTYIYLKFVNNKLSHYFINQSPNFTIMYYRKSLFTGDEDSYFIQSFNKARNLALIEYIDTFDNRYPFYSLLIISNLLSNTVKFFMTSYIEKYSLKNYTRKQINDIFISKGLPKLVEIENDELAKKVIINLDRLVSYKSSQNILKELYDVLNDRDLSIYRLFLIKKYPIDEQGKTNIDINSLPEYNKKLEIEKVKVVGNDTSSNSTLDYNSVTDKDNLWSGFQLDDPTYVRELIIKQYERDLVSLDFYRLKTKYILLSKIIEIIQANKRINDIFSLMMQYNMYIQSNTGTYPFLDDIININEKTSSSPMTVFSAIAYLGKLMQMDEADARKIDYNKIVSINTLVLRDYEGVQSVLDVLEDGEISIASKILTRRIIDYITREEMQKFFPYWELNDNTTLNDVLFTYDTDVIGVNKLEEIMIMSSKQDEYLVYKKIFSYVRKNVNFSKLYNDYNDYIEFINEEGNPLYKYLEENELINYTDKPTQLKIKEHMNFLTKQFNTYLNTFLVNNIFSSDENNTVDDVYIRDMTLLFNEFLSILSSLYQFEYNISMSNPMFNILRIRYFTSDIMFSIKNNDSFEIIYDNLLKRINMDLDMEELKTLYDFNYVLKLFIDEGISLKIKHETLTELITNIVFDNIILNPILSKFTMNSKIYDNLKLIDNLDIFLTGFDLKFAYLFNIRENVTDKINLFFNEKCNIKYDLNKNNISLRDITDKLNHFDILQIYNAQGEKL